MADGSRAFEALDTDNTADGAVEARTIFRLELLHVADQEASSPAVFDAPRLSAVMNALEAQDVGEDATLRLSSGDAILPGLFFQASAAVFGQAGVADMIIQNELGWDAIAFGNHEFDFGPAFIGDLIDGTFDTDGNAATPETALLYSLAGVPAYAGTLFPYLSANLDFSTEPSLAPLAVAGGGAPRPNTVTSSVVLEAGGELIGVVGATTPTIDIISNPGSLGILPADFDGAPTDDQIAALAAVIQAEVDALLAANPGMNKVILLAHMQQIAIELKLAGLLTHVDIIVAGGSNTRLFDDNDRARPGDSDQGQYPQVVENAGGTDTLVVNTDGSYKYVGRLVIDFDANGNIIAESYDETVSGAYATDAQGVADLGAEGLVDPEIKAVADLIAAEIASKESNVFGVSDVYLQGLRPEVRQEETNLGNLTADANLAEARKTDPTVLVSIKNGGGIRDDIGDVLVPPGGAAAVGRPNEEVLAADGSVIKPAGGISQNDIGNALRFNNDLSLLTLTGAELRAALEHGVAASTYDALGGVNQQGRFPQVAGVTFSFDPDLAPGSRIVNADVMNQDGSVAVTLVRDGVTVSPDASIRIVTLGFLANGGDGYPLNLAADPNRVDLLQSNVRTGVATFADDGTEQDALAEYLAANFLTTAYAEADTDIAGDLRIRNLNFRTDAIYISEIIEGSSNNKAVEIYNDTGFAIDLAAQGYALRYYFNGNVNPGLTIALTGTVDDGQTYVVAQSAAAAEILAVANQTNGSGWFNGDDVIVLTKNGAIVDSFGQIGVDPGSEWQGGGQDDTLRRKDAINAGDADATDAFDAAVEWDVFPINDFSNLGLHKRDTTRGDDGDDEEAPLALISAIQGAGAASPLAGQRVTVQAVVTVVSNQLDGFFLQEEAADSDGDPATSEGIFVFTGSDPTVSVGDLVRFEGNVSEFFTLTQLSGLGEITVLAKGVALPSAIALTLPLPDATDPAAFYESIEGMRVRVTAAEGETLRVTDAFTNFGEVGVTAGSPLVQPTQAFESFSPEAEALDAANARNILVFQNTEDDSLSSAPRVGDGIVGGAIEGAMNFTFGEYKVETQGAVDFDPSVNPNPRQEAPEDVGGRLKVASFNVLNYFTTLIGEDANARGAATAEQLAAQTAKIVAAITAIDADVLGLIEIENDLAGAPDEAVAALVDAINAALGAPVYSYIATGRIGTDAIKQAILYKSATVAPTGAFAVLDTVEFTDPLGSGGPLSRPAIAQSFTEVATGEVFTVSVNHLKSKGSPSGVPGDDSPVEGSAALTRVAAMQELAEWIASDPTGSGDADHLTLGDFNAYAMERAIKALEAEGFTNLNPEGAVSYFFNGEGGTLDYAFANESMAGQVVGSTIWNINSLEAYSIQYNGRDFAAFGDLSAFASSDHDPVIVGLDLFSEPELNVVQGGDGADVLVGTDMADLIIGGGGSNLLSGLGGADVFLFGDELANGRREVTQIRDYTAGEDIIDLGGYEIASVRESRAGVRLTMEGDGDTIWVRGVSTLDEITFADDLLIA
jgi:predicted extracellular nuclease/2',3'-cyclic-nucleotide 2'-phosphodiesterase (5'-nucleotidase family)